MSAVGAARIADAFAQRAGRAALMPYLMGGYPDLDGSRDACAAAAAASVDLIEISFPFSDPLAQGPVMPPAGN
ncbi:MAG: tryptophan synthase subunit alpha, partial [Thermoleophilaceae bacterium]